MLIKWGTKIANWIQKIGLWQGIFVGEFKNITLFIRRWYIRVQCWCWDLHWPNFLGKSPLVGLLNPVLILPWSWVPSLLRYSVVNWQGWIVFSLESCKRQQAAIIYAFAVSMLVPIYLPTGTTTSKHFIFANLYNDTLVILTTATFV